MSDLADRPRIAQAALGGPAPLVMLGMMVVKAPPPEFLGLASDAWAAIGQMLLGVGAVFGAWWAIYSYKKSRRHEAAIRLQEIYRDFYLAGTFTKVRQILEYHYTELVDPLLSKRIKYPGASTTEAEEVLLCELDTFLNYFEYIISLEEEHRFSPKDRQAMLKYWLDLMRKHETLKRYTVEGKFTRVAAALSKDPEE